MKLEVRKAYRKAENLHGKQTLVVLNARAGKAGVGVDVSVCVGGVRKSLINRKGHDVTAT